MKTSVAVAVIGAGHAGLNAIKEIRQVTDDWVLINGGPLGTTCARIGCMPSKVALHLAETCQSRERLDRLGVGSLEAPALDQPAALAHVRDLRDTFVDLVLANTTDEMDDEHLLGGYARFLAPDRLAVGDHEITARRVIIATGARSVVPPSWRELCGEDLLTVDNLFEQETLPESVAVIGLGPIGVELGQALHRLGVRVTGIGRNPHIAGIRDPRVNQAALEALGREFPLWTGVTPRIERCAAGYRVQAGTGTVEVARLFLAVGRRPALDRLGLADLGLPLDAAGVPRHDPQTLRVGRLPLYLAGDATGGIANLQRAAAQGRVAGYNATHRRSRRLPGGTALAIIFSEPNIAFVGRQWDDLDPARVVVAGQRFGPVGRALIMGQNRGLLRVYADRASGRLLGAAMVGPRCEHLAHLLAWAIEARFTIERALAMPFYHPVIEEALQDALLDLRHQLHRRRSGPFGALAARWRPRPATA